MRRWLLAVGLAGLLVLSGPAAGVAAADGHASQRPAEPSVSVDATRDGSEVVYDIRVDDLAAIEQLTVSVGRHVEVAAIEGGDAVNTTGRTQIQWFGADRLRVVVRADAASIDDSAGTDFFVTDEWVLGPVPFVELRWWAEDGGIHRERPLREGAGYLASTDDGIYGDRYALVGPHESISHRAHGQQFRIVTPAGTEIGPDVTAVQSSLASASRRLQVGDRDDSVLLFGLPEGVRSGGESVPARDEAWVRADSAVNDPNNVWVHEYVHTRQDFELTSEMRWFREASAEYYAARLTYDQGRISRQAMLDHLAGPDKPESLTDPAAWSDGRLPYTKGARVLAVLDRNIRQSTDGRQSLADVFRLMNQRDDRVSYATFRDLVAAVAGHRMDAWLDRYVAGDHAAPSVHGPPARTSTAGFLPVATDLLGVGVATSAGVTVGVLGLLARWRQVRTGRRAGPRAPWWRES